MKPVLFMCLCLQAISATAFAQSIPAPGDYYLIARSSENQFRSSHKIFVRPSDGLRKVTYCNRTYWVRPYTVAWSQIQVENELQVRVEYNGGKGWRPICEDPERQVTLSDLGIAMDPRDVLYVDPETSAALSRMDTIGRAFRTQFGNKNTDRTKD
ncbi:hypothetical protein [Roseibium sp. RKSG952]|uniref:hypothetical protein n=1 Tax=Roseibium sp. RKSG952 TaxID=2529384 RepID=UPI0012BC416A|nr:hypothetical protein [Roseibium sp. RKSG952]MTH96882.1 hypothetical protein [Roseibium sp. RKSG952]